MFTKLILLQCVRMLKLLKLDLKSKLAPDDRTKKSEVP